MNKIILACLITLSVAAILSFKLNEKDELDDKKMQSLVAQLKKDKDARKKFLQELFVDEIAAKDTKPESVEQCTDWILEHETSDIGAIIPAKSFLIKMDTLIKHMNNLVDSDGNIVDPNDVKYLHVFLARKAGTKDSTTIVISAVRVVGTIGEHVYQNINKKSYVLEHSIPCPDCADGAIKVHNKLDNSDPL